VIGSQLSYRNILDPKTQKLLRFSDRYSDAVLVNCEAIRRYMVEDEHVAAGKVELCYNGVNTTEFFPAEEARPPELASADLVIAYGSGTAATALLAGVPLLLVPQLIEQFIVGRRVEELGAGLYMREERTQHDFAGAIATLRSEASYRQSAGSFAKKYAGFRSDLAASRVAAIVEAAMVSTT